MGEEEFVFIGDIYSGHIFDQAYGDRFYHGRIMVCAAEGPKDEKLVGFAVADGGTFTAFVVLAVAHGEIMGRNRSKAGRGICSGVFARDGGFDGGADFSMAKSESQDMARIVAGNYSADVCFDGYVMV